MDDAALAVALREKRIAAAGLDVFEGEPKVHPDLLTVPNVVLTPHIASATIPTRLAMANLAADNLIGFLTQGRALTPINPEVLARMTLETLTWVLLFLVALNLLLGIWLLLRRRPVDAEEAAHRLQVLGQGQQLGQRVERVESELRREISESSRGGRQEIQQTLATFQETLTRQDAEATRTQNTQLDAFAQQLLQLRGTLGDTLTQQLQAISLGMGQQAAEATRTQNAQIDAFAQQLLQLRGTLGDTLTKQLQDMSEGNARRLAEIRTTLENQLAQLQQTNTAKLDEMRATVDEKLQSTLQARLGESFKQVADRLEQVHKGLGEMQTLAQGVGDLKHLLTNVKTRGMFGEAQLSALLEQVFAPDQYATQVATRPGSRNVVDFAIKLPGSGRRRRAVLVADRRQVSRTKTTSACSMRNSAPTSKALKRRRAGWSSASSLKPKAWQRSTWSRRTPPTSPSCSCPPKACTPRCCGARA